MIIFYNKNLNAKEEIHVPCQASLAASDLSKIRLRGRYTGLYAGMQWFGGSTIPGEFTVSYKTLGYLHQLLDDSFAQNLQEMRNMSVINLVPLTTARLIIRKDRRTNLGSKVGPNRSKKSCDNIKLVTCWLPASLGVGSSYGVDELWEFICVDSGGRR